MPKNKGVRANGRDIGGTKMEPPSDVPTLADLGLDKKTSNSRKNPSIGWKGFTHLQTAPRFEVVAYKDT